MNCTAAQDQGLAAELYGDYMDGIGSIAFNVGEDLSQAEYNKINNESFARLICHSKISIRVVKHNYLLFDGRQRAQLSC